jgi:pumilio family protein 6
MPNRVVTKSTMNGTKRKGAPSRDAGAKDNKKLKIDSSRKAATHTRKTKPKLSKNNEESSSDNFDSDGGAPLYNKNLADSDDLEESDTTEFSSEGKTDASAKDGVNPDRPKAAAANSKCFELRDNYNTYNC